MNTSVLKLSAPNDAALIHSETLIQLIRKEIQANQGQITFARFMELALYAPGLGYYSAGLQKLGHEGDFVTAPELSPLFTRCLARQCQQVLAKLGIGSILEFGAGSGILAVDLLSELEKNQSLPVKYCILEVSADLQQRQQQLCKERIPHLFDRIQWLTCLPTPQSWQGIVLANEVLDAFPVHRFRVDIKEIQEYYVSIDNNKFHYKIGKPSCEKLVEKVKQLSIEALSVPYDSEVNLLLPEWIKTTGGIIKQGLMLLIDYGFPCQEYYHPDRAMGTLMCHYRHFAHPDPLIIPGLQDITAHVDFTAVAESAVAIGLDVAGFTTQAAFLLNCGLLEIAGSEGMDATINKQIQLSQQIQRLTSPNEMGDLFKVIALTREFDEELVGFSNYDQRRRL
jgi:SAM-dependent MidA family methyltransferase